MAGPHEMLLGSFLVYLNDRRECSVSRLAYRWLVYEGSSYS
jgi:hypothetical protein